ERLLLAARPHTFAQEVRIKRRERNDHDDGEDCEIRPKARDGDRAGGCEQCGGRGDHEQACLEVSRDWHPLRYHFRGSEMVPHMALDQCRSATSRLRSTIQARTKAPRAKADKSAANAWPVSHRAR